MSKTLMRSYTKTSAEILAYYRQISREMFTVVDLETTGGKGDCDRIIEISVLQANLEDGILNISTNLINPQIPIPQQIVRFTGITQAMVKDVASSDRILPNYLPTLQTGILTAHNFRFDYGFLQAEYRRLAIDFHAQAQLCTVELSRLLLAHLPSRSLPNLVKHFGFEVGESHRAESDAIACWLLLEKLLRQVQNADDAEILDLIGQQWLPLKDVAIILRLPLAKVESLLSEAKVESRFSYHKQIKLYRRGGIENLANQIKVETEVITTQLSLPI